MLSRDVVESVGDAVLIAEVTGGHLGREVTLQYSTSDGTATSEYHQPFAMRAYQKIIIVTLYNLV